MQQRTRVRLYDVHSWTGAVLGPFVFALCFSGTAALFFNEMEPWERPAARGAMPERTALDAAVSAARAEAGEAFPAQFFVYAPDRWRNTIRLGYQPTAPGTDYRVIEADPVTGALLGPYRQGVGRFLRNLHTDLHLPKPWGRYLVGLGGIVMLLSIVTGVATHAKIIANLHVFRPDRSRRLAWADAHNVAGVWALPFHAMIAFTGAIIGLAGLFLIPLALATTGGDREAAVAAIVGEAPRASGEAARMSSLDAILADARARSPEARASGIEVRHWGDANAVAHVRVEDGPDLRHVSQHRYALATGAFLKTWSISDTAAGRVYAANTPLHYATFGGLALKALYAVLGLAACFVVASGMVVWLERRAQRRAPAAPWISGLFVGATAGMGLATAGAIAAHHAVPESADRVFATGAVYFALWLGAAGYDAWRGVAGGAAPRDVSSGAAPRGDDRRVLRETLSWTAGLFALAPLVRLVAEGPTLWAGAATALATDGVLVALALGTTALGHAVPRSDTSSRRRRDVVPTRPAA